MSNQVGTRIIAFLMQGFFILIDVSFFPAGCNLQECGPKEYCYQATGPAECRCVTNYKRNAAGECVYSPGTVDIRILHVFSSL